jgi:ABC transporter permease/ATP binding protein
MSKIIWLKNNIDINKWNFILIVCLTLFSSVIIPMPSLVLKKIIDGGFNNVFKENIHLVILYLLSPVFLGIVSIFLSKYSITFSEELTNSLQKNLYKNTTKKNIDFFINNSSGIITQKIVRESGELSQYINSITINLISQFITLVTTIYIMIKLNYILTILIFLFIPLYLIPTIFSKKLTLGLNKQSLDERSKSLQNIQETLNIGTYMTIKLLTGFKKEIEEFTGIVKKISYYNIKRTVRIEFLNTLNSITTTMLPILIFFLYLYMFPNDLDISVFIVFLTYINIIGNIFKNSFNILNKIPMFFQILDRLSEYTSEYMDVSYGKETITDKKIDIKFENVGVEKNGKKILNNINLEIKSGEKVIIVGESGSGKTSILNLISRFCLPKEGTIKFNNRNILNFNEESFIDNVYYAIQEPTLFNKSIRKNILYGNENKNNEDLMIASKKSYIYEDVQKLQEKYDTVIGESGFNFSTGQKQRVAIARIFLKNKPLILLDEITASLDKKNEQLILDTLLDDFKDSTCIMVSHNLFNIKYFDRVILIKDGRIEWQSKVENYEYCLEKLKSMLRS